MQRRKVWLLFTAVIIAVFAMVGCLPEVTPDKTPPEITAQSATLSATQIDQGDPVTVTVSVTAKDKRSNLKETVMKLFLKKPGQTTFTQVGTATVAFADAKEDTKTNAFQVAGTNFQTGGDYTFKAEITASDSKGNTSTAVEAQPSGALHVQGATPSGPTVTITYPSTSHYSEGRYTVVPEVFNLKVVANDPDSDLVELRVVLQSNTQTLLDRTETSQGVASLTVEQNGIAPELGDNLEATMTLHVSARDSNGTVKSEDIDLVARKQDIAVIETLDSVRGNEANQLPKVSHFKIPPATAGDIVQQPEADRLSVPFGLSKMWVAFHDDDVNVNDTIKAYVYTNSTDIFSGDEYAFRAETTVNGEKRAYIEVPNFWRQSDVDEAKWLVLSVFHNGGSTPVIRYVWNITARGDTANPIFDIVESSSDFDEGVPLYFEAAATDELLEAITDLGVQVNIGQSGWEPLEDAINRLNSSVPAEDDYQFALRYHVKVKMDLADTTYASGLVDDGIDYIVSNAVTNHEDIRWFDIFHGVIPGMPEDPQTQADYWWKTDGLSNLIGEDDDDSYFGGNTPNEEPYTTNIPNYKELDHRTLDKRQYVYEFTDLDTTKVQKIKTEAFVEQVKFKVWIYPEVVRASRDDLASQVVRPNVIDVVDVAIGPGTWKDQHVDYKVAMEVADWRWGGNNPDTGKTQETANFTIEEDELSPTIEVSGFDASQQNVPFLHVFRDNDDLFTLSDDVHYPLGMYFIDDIEVFSGGEVTIRAKDDIALNDLLVYFDSTEAQTNGETDVPRSPFISRNSPYSHPLTGYDYKYSPSFTVFKLQEGREEQGDAETVVLSDFDPGFVERRLRLFGSDFNINGNTITPAFGLDRDYEYYVNFTNDDVVNAEELAAHNNTFGRENDVYLGASEDSTYEPYSGEYSNTFRGYIAGENSVNQVKAEYTFQVPDVEGDYYVWIVARDRSAQDTKLFDYPANVNEDYFLEGSLGEYDPVVLKGYQNEIFGDTVSANGNPNYDLQYYDDSMSEDDADMVVLLRIRVKPHSWDIMRLDIHEPDLVSYPTEDSDGTPIWYSHSYSPWQVPEEFNDSDLKVDVRRLPRDMYPVYKFYNEYKEGYRPIYTSGKIDPFGYQEGDSYNAYGVTEVNAPGTAQDSPLREFVPIVGGANGTDFRVRTHEDLTRVTLYLVEGEYWYNETMEQAYGNLDTNPSVIASVTMNANDNDKKWGFWEWHIDDWADVEGHDLMGQEATYTIAVRAYHSTVTDPRVFFEQFQWPFFLDTRGPELQMYNVDPELESTIPWVYDGTKSYTNIQDKIEEGRDEWHPYPVGEMVALQAQDGGALLFENDKGTRLIKDGTPPPAPLAISSLTYPGGTWEPTMETDRADDLVNHQLRIKAGDTTTYERYWKQDLNDFSGSWRLGFPGTSTELVVPDAVTNSLKYLNDGVVDVEYFNRPAVLGSRYMNYMSNIYSGSLKQVFQGALPTNALFHNIDFEDYIWRNMGTPQQAFNVSLVDELGNAGTWESYLRKYEDLTLTATMVKALPEQFRNDTLTLNATLAENETIVRVDVKEITAGFPSGPTVQFTSPTYLIDNTIVGLPVTGVVQPGYQATRTFNISVLTQAGYRASSELTIPATYAGTPPTLALNMKSNLRDLVTELNNSGKSHLIPLLRPDERYYVDDLSNPFTVGFQSADDNKDMYNVVRAATRVEHTGATTALPFTALPIFNQPDTLVETDFTDTLPSIAESGHYLLSIDADDCADCNDVPAVNQRVYYQDPNTFVQTISATGTAPGGLATGVYIEFQSDVFFENADDLLANITFSKVVGGVDVAIPMDTVYQYDTVSGTWILVGDTIGRNNRFIFKAVNPFTDPISSPMSARGETHGFKVKFVKIISVAVSEANLEGKEFRNDPPTAPGLLTPADGSQNTGTTVDFDWTASSDPDGDNIYYMLVYAEKDNLDILLTSDVVTDTEVEVGPYDGLTGLKANTKYYWMVIAADFNGGNSSYLNFTNSDARWFYTGSVTDTQRNNAVKAVLNELDGTAYGSFNETTGFDGTTHTATITNVATGTTVKNFYDALEAVVENNEEFLFPVTLGTGTFPGVDLTGTYATLEALKAKLQDAGLFDGTKLSAALNDGAGAATVVTFDIMGVTYTFNVVNQ